MVRLRGAGAQLCKRGASTQPSTPSEGYDPPPPHRGEPEPDPDIPWSRSFGYMHGSLAAKATADRWEASYRAWMTQLVGPVRARELHEHGLQHEHVQVGDPDEAPYLARRERDVLRCAAYGLGPVATARFLGIAPNSVKTHRKNAKARLGVKSIESAVAVAMRGHGLNELPWL